MPLRFCVGIAALGYRGELVDARVLFSERFVFIRNGVVVVWGKGDFVDVLIGFAHGWETVYLVFGSNGCHSIVVHMGLRGE